MQNINLSETTDEKSSSILGSESSIEFTIDDEVIMEFRSGGRILIKGKLVEDDKQVVDAMRKFLKHSGFLPLL